MADATPKPEIPTVRIAQEIPVVFADAILTQSYGFGVTKMYLNRYDPDPGLTGPARDVIVMQLVMPIDNFVRSVVFLEDRLATMVRTGAVTQTFVDECRKAYAAVNVVKPNA